jgi:hypothetical protein
MTIRELVAIKNIIKENKKDSLVTNKQIYNYAKSARNTLLSRQGNKKTLYSQNNLWTTVCVDMIPVNSITCNFPYSSCDTIYRSKDRLNFIESDLGFNYKQATSIDLKSDTEFTITNWFGYKQKSKIKFNKTKYLFIEDGYLYSPEPIQIIKIIGLFELCNSCGDSKCSYLDMKFAVPDSLEQAVKDIVLQRFGIVKQLPEDVVNNKNTNIQAVQ